MVRNIKIHGGVNMFEKEAEERARKLEEKQTLGVYDNDEDLARDEGFNNGEVAGYENGFIEGAGFGYNKANEWHYVKDGDLPKDDKQYLVLFFYNYKGKKEMSFGVRDNLHSDFEIHRCYTEQIIAWKEIVLPKEIKEDD